MSVISRRSRFLGGAALLATTRFASAQAPAGPFTLAPLPYAPEANEPHIDAQTMTIHHGRHHQAYVTNLNAAIEKAPELASWSLEQLNRDIAKVPESVRTAVRNNGGGHWNHTFFWASMKPPGQGGAPSAPLLAAIDRDFGSLDAFKAAFKTAGTGRFGSGWVWLILTADGKLQITSTPNQDNPLMDVVTERGIPLLGNDVWEHAYYLQYQNRRADYLEAWWQVVDWQAVSSRYAAAAK